MQLGIDPKIDYAFKHLFGRETNVPILASLLRAILNLPPTALTRLEILNPFNEKEFDEDKLSIVDVKARDASAGGYNVEMQMVARRFFPNRIVYYWARFHQEQLQGGQDYGQLLPTIGIGFLNNVLFADETDYHHVFRLVDARPETRKYLVLTRDIEFHLFELPKFRKTLAELRTELDRWLYFLRHAEELDIASLPAELQDAGISLAWEDLKMVAQSELEYQRYEAQRKLELDALTERRWNEKKLKEAEEEAKAAEIRGEIHGYQRLLQLPLTPAAELNKMSSVDLDQLKAKLQSQIARALRPQTN